MTLFEQFYDADYERARDKLIHKAEVKANRDFGKACKAKGNRKALDRFAAGWSGSFHRIMAQLVKEAKLLDM